MDIDYKLADINQILLELYRNNKEKLKASSPEFVNEIREKAFERFSELKLPGKKSEEYKYLNVEKLLNKDIKYSLDPKEIEFEIEDIFSCDIPELDTRAILVLNGFFYPQGEMLVRMENGVIMGSLREAMKQYPDLVQKHYGKYADFENDSLTALNSAFSQDGVFLYVPKNTVFEQPVQIIHLLLANESLMVQHRNLFVLEENAEAKVLICDHTLSTDEYITNSVTEVFTAPNAKMDITRVQNEHNKSIQLTNTYVHQERASVANTNTITLHGGTIRNNLRVTLADENCENNALGLFLADQDQHVDNFTYVNHTQPNCLSNQLYKGILDDKATGAFNGRIHVWKDAQKTLAYQKNNNILLTDTATMNSKPQLEIYADDVKCSHGATVGQLDEDALFYLRSRGIPEKESRLLMMYAFANDVIAHIKLPALKERITELVDKRLRGELSRCNNCKIKCR
jgi:Fe-S cluster assembly protein SufD